MTTTGKPMSFAEFERMIQRICDTSELVVWKDVESRQDPFDRRPYQQQLDERNEIVRQFLSWAKQRATI